MTRHPLDLLPPRGKPPSTVRAIETWIQQAERTESAFSERSRARSRYPVD